MDFFFLLNFFPRNVVFSPDNIGFVLRNSRVLVFLNMVYQEVVGGFLFPPKIFS